MGQVAAANRPSDDERVKALWTPVADEAALKAQWTPVVARPAPAVAEPNTVGTFASHVEQQANPLRWVQGMGQMLPLPKALGGAGIDAPLKAGAGILQAQNAVKAKGDEAWAKGDHVTAVRHYLDWLVPVLGPIMDQAADRSQRGELAAGAGDAAGLGLAMFGPTALARATQATPNLTRPEPPSGPAPTRPTASALQFAKDEGIPVDAATRTDNNFVRGAQKASENMTLSGAAIAKRANAATASALDEAGRRLAGKIAETPQTPETAGLSTQQAVTQVVKDFAADAGTHYATLRQIEADPKFTERVHTAPEGGTVARSILGKLAAGTEHGQAPTRAERLAMRQIEAELDAHGFTARTWNWLEDGPKDGNAAGGAAQIVKGSAGAPVYDQILQAAPGTADMTRGQVQRGIATALETGEWNNAARGAYEVAKQRVAEGFAGGPSLPADAPLVGSTRTVGLPVEMKPVKKLIAPIHARLLREAELVPLQGDKARALVALDRLMNGPDIESASVVDAALGDLKGMARATPGAATRTQGQGLAAAVVGPLDAAVRKAVALGGPDATAALEAGRAATVNKYAVADVLEPLMRGRGEPVAAYRLLTSPGDAAIQQLRAVAEAAPMEVPKVGRAWLESALDSATAEGGFGKADKLFADWQRMGPQTKRVLFGAETTAKLDDFFLLAKKLAKNPNPSGSAFVGGTAVHLFDLAYLHNLPAAAGMELSGAAIAKLAHSPKAMDALNNVLRLGTLSPAVVRSVPQAVKQAAVVSFVRRAAEAGVDVSKAAARSPEEPTK